ncbi:lipopolysaccharide biosynthesis protein [Sphingomonas sp. AX6]|uniref:lipopolysaccharide biosynthesis protein n=1 Tax=Sphingomonas sp. AX6 TaxID=2653171 RepID=UPI0012F46EBB|nr:lipopolysaccharide biosynthesis protein [Sphingomonas sp. AX6]VXC76975.1 Lipopolysaccharide biosynthesis protein [Sphingomonas sp. AX6]
MTIQTPIEAAPEDRASGMIARVRSAVFWRSGSQFAAQLVMWASTFLVIRLLEPEDYGLFAMTQVVLVLLNLMNGWGFASALVRDEHCTHHQQRQVFGMLVLLNFSLGAGQFLLAPLAADYFNEPMVADLLRVQAILYIANPFMALPSALLARRMDFKRQAQVRMVSATLGAITAFACASTGWGVWTLVAAPMVYFFAEGIGMSWAARAWMWPSFDFRGATHLFRFGGAMMLVQFFWFVQSQSDVFIGGRYLSAHDLGIYTTALFLTQILASKFVPALNEVAFAAYAQIQDDRAMLASSFAKTVRLILLVTLPAYVGMAATAEPMVLTFLGEKWVETAAIIPILALAMPFLTLQILFAPATNALGKPGIALGNSVAGGLVLPVSFGVGIAWGITGLSIAWFAGMAALTIVTAIRSMPVIGASWRALGTAIAPGLLAALAMGVVVVGIDGVLPALSPPLTLLVLAGLGVATYAVLLWLFARNTVREAWALLRNR